MGAHANLYLLIWALSCGGGGGGGGGGGVGGWVQPAQLQSTEKS